VAQFGRTSFALLDADQAKRVRVQRKGASQPTGREATISQTEVRVALYPKFNITSGCGSVWTNELCSAGCRSSKASEGAEKRSIATDRA